MTKRVADTVVLLAGPSPAILEKPENKVDQMDMLQSYRGEQVQVVTGVTIGASSSPSNQPRVQN